MNYVTLLQTYRTNMKRKYKLEKDELYPYYVDIKEDKKGISLNEEDVKEYIKARKKFLFYLWRIRKQE